MTLPRVDRYVEGRADRHSVIPAGWKIPDANGILVRDYIAMYRLLRRRNRCLGHFHDSGTRVVSRRRVRSKQGYRSSQERTVRSVRGPERLDMAAERSIPRRRITADMPASRSQCLHAYATGPGQSNDQAFFDSRPEKPNPTRNHKEQANDMAFRVILEKA